MGVELGRISGPLLATNLVRHGIDLAFETDLLYLYVSDNDPANFKVGIKTDTPGRLLDIANKLTSVNLIVDNTLTVPNFDIHTNEIQNLTGTIYIRPTGQTLDGILDGGLSGTISFAGEEDGGGAGTLVFNPLINGGNSSPFGSAPQIHAPALTTDNLKITDQLIKNLITNSDIELNPSGDGIVRFNSYEVNINGSLHATGDVTWDGSITFGNDNTDNVNLSADITSDIIPDITNTYDLGSTLKRWRNLYSDEVIATNLETDTLTINNIDLLLTPGNTIYVSKNGSDTNYGTHAHSTFATLKQALSSAVSGDTIIMFPGTYEEEFPLTVPSGVGVRGSGIRATTIKPTLATKSKDAFLISGDTLLEFFTISDFYFDSVNNTGYAFRFANGFKTTGRSPYFHNITVKTQGSVTSPSDLRGFASGDAGAGGYFDGSVADPTSNVIPTALFFSVTFITPNADALTLLNGVRCEWLNSFSYFAKRGLYLVNGTAGRYNQGTVFGAELRSINSANVYGTYGAVADGASTLAYLIGHNFGYVGTGGDYTNDPTLAIQAQEVAQLNDGIIYFETTDHLGDIRVGDIFYVSQATGLIAFDAQSINIGAGGNITIEGPTSTTVINELGYQTGNIRVYDNTISSIIGPVNFLANGGANTTYINTNVEVAGSLGISADLIADSNVYFGSDALDNITVNAYLTQDINPKDNDTLYLGSTSFRWLTLNANLLDVNGKTQITSNRISTLASSDNVILTANGTGLIRAATNDVQIDNSLEVVTNLTVNGVTSLKNTEITGTSTVIGDIGQTGDTYITGTFANNNTRITGNSYFQVPNIRLYNNVISNQSTDQDLIFAANGTGAVRVEKLDFLNNTIANAWVGATTDSQKSIILSPNGTGNTVINSTNALKLPVGSNSIKTIYTAGEIRYNNSYNRYEGYQPNGLVSFNNLYTYDTTSSKYITSATKTTLSTTTVSVVQGEYTIQVSTTAGLSIGYRVVSGPSLTPGATILNIDANIITLDLPTTNSITGVVVFGPTTLNFALISGLQVGQAVSGTNIQVGSTIVSWNSTSVTLSLPISGNVLIGSTINFGAVNSTYITPELTPGAADNIIRFGINGSVKATLSSTAFASNSWHVGNIDITSNNISQLTSNALYFAPDSGITTINNLSIADSIVTNNLNSEMLIQATGQGYIKFSGKGAVVFPIGDDSQRRPGAILGETRYNSERGYLEVHNSIDWIPAIGTTGAASQDEVDEIMNVWSLVLG